MSTKQRSTSNRLGSSSLDSILEDAELVIEEHLPRRFIMYLIGFVVLWFVVLVSGTVFYSQYDNIGLDRGFYNAVSMAYTIGWCPSPISTEDNGSKMFSTIYIICGGFGFVAVTVFIAETIINGNDKWFAMYLQRATMKRKDMTILEKIGSFYEDYFYTICSWLVVLFFIFLGIVWSLAVVGWTITDAVLFTFSTLARCGIGGLPEDTPAWAFAFAGFYGAFSIIAVSLAIGFTSENVLTSLQNERATSIVNDRPTKKELGFLKEIGCDVTNNADSLTKNQFMLLVVARLGLVDYDLIRLVYQRFDNIKADAVDFNENVPTRRDFYSQGLRTFLEVNEKARLTRADSWRISGKEKVGSGKDQGGVSGSRGAEEQKGVSRFGGEDTDGEAERKVGLE